MHTHTHTFTHVYAHIHARMHTHTHIAANNQMEFLEGMVGSGELEIKRRKRMLHPNISKIKNISSRRAQRYLHRDGLCSIPLDSQVL